LESTKLLARPQDSPTEPAAQMATATYGKLDNRASSALARLPVRRVAAKDNHVPYEPTLEKATLPQAEDIAEGIRSLLAF
jgi:pyruvate/2-oxoglutarate/acetoin dehydrogenase E1 component